MNQRWVYMCPASCPLPPPSPSHPSELSQCTSFECPASCIELGLVICSTYGNIHVSMLFSQIIPLFPFPTEFNSLFFIYVSLLLYHVFISPLFWRIILPDMQCAIPVYYFFSISALNNPLHSFCCMVFEEKSDIVLILIFLLVDYLCPSAFFFLNFFFFHLHSLFISCSCLVFWSLNKKFISTPKSARVAEHCFI